MKLPLYALLGAGLWIAPLNTLLILAASAADAAGAARELDRQEAVAAGVGRVTTTSVPRGSSDRSSIEPP